MAPRRTRPPEVVVRPHWWVGGACSRCSLRRRARMRLSLTPGSGRQVPVFDYSDDGVVWIERRSPGICRGKHAE